MEWWNPNASSHIGDLFLSLYGKSEKRIRREEANGFPVRLQR
jgi:hypothetical protein